MDKLARIIAYVFHPMLMPLIGCALIFNTVPYFTLYVDRNVQWLIYGVAAVFTFLLPLLNVLYLKRSGMVSSIRLENRKERRLPFLLTAVYYILGYYLLSNAAIPRVVSFMMLGSALAVAVVFGINTWWKISAHMTGIGGLTGTVIFLAFHFSANMAGIVMILFFTAGLIGFARLQTASHTPPQLYAGFITGFLCEVVTLFLFV